MAQKQFSVTYQGGESYSVGNLSFARGRPQTLSEGEARQFMNQQDSGWFVSELRAPEPAPARAPAPAEGATAGEEETADDVAPNFEDPDHESAASGEGEKAPAASPAAQPEAVKVAAPAAPKAKPTPKAKPAPKAPPAPKKGPPAPPAAPAPAAEPEAPKAE